MTFAKRALGVALEIFMALGIIGASVVLYRFGLVHLIAWALPLSDLSLTVIRRVGVTVSLVLGYWLAARAYERRKPSELTFKPLAISISAFAGAALIGITLLALYALGNYRLLSYRGFFAAPPVIAMIGFAAIFEEVIFRGVIFRIFEKHAGTVKALVVQSLLFGFLHVFNEATTVMTVISVTVLGAFWTLVFVHSRNLWVVVANHAAWNVMIFVSGVPLSGQEDWRAAALFETAVQGPSWLTGGGFGPEDSIVNLVVMACTVGAFAAWVKRNRAEPASINNTPDSESGAPT